MPSGEMDAARTGLHVRHIVEGFQESFNVIEKVGRNRLHLLVIQAITLRTGLLHLIYIIRSTVGHLAV